eukprot:2638733-Pleurochrysis_carterae.AAC.1
MAIRPWGALGACNRLACSFDRCDTSCRIWCDVTVQVAHGGVGAIVSAGSRPRAAVGAVAWRRQSRRRAKALQGEGF